MKILRVALENIASMAGLQIVDLTAEPLHSTGLFSIIGPTGSGKSTLLDAICLALYNETPRLTQVKGNEQLDDLTLKDPRNLLRRGEGSGWTEVVFQANDGTICTARWSVRRARNRADGRFQPVSMALYRGATEPGSEVGDLISGGKLTEVKQAIADRVGLSFEQFTRAVMLAQNEFATFLKANDSDRSEILQTLTGTDQFERISIAVYQRAKQVRQDLEKLETELQVGLPLSDAERAALELSQQQADAALQQVRRQQEQTDQRLKWYETETAFREKSQSATRSLQQAQQAFANADSRRQDLQQTELILQQAQPLMTRLKEASLATAKRLAAQQEQERQLAKQIAEQEQLQQAVAAAKAELTEHREKLTAAKPQLQEARAIEARLPGLGQQLQAAKADQHRCHQLSQERAEALASCEETVGDLQQQRDALSDRLQSLIGWQPFAASADLWINRLRDLHDQTTQTTRLTDQENALRSTLQELQQQQSPATAACDQQREIVNTAKQQVAAAEQRLSETNEQELERELQAHEKQLEDLSSVEEFLKERDSLAKQRDDHRQQLAQLQLQLNDVCSELKTCQAQIPQATQHRNSAREFRNHIVSAVEDATERLRAQLQPESPCPVCGSLEHPWHDSADAPTRAALNAADAALQQAEQALEQFNQQKSDLTARQKTLTDTLTTAHQQEETLAARWQDLQPPCPEHPIFQLEEPAQRDECESQRRTTELRRDACRNRRSELTTFRETRDQLRQTLDVEQEKLHTHETARKDLESHLREATGRLQDAAKNRSQRAEELRKRQEQLAELWQQHPALRDRFEREPNAAITSAESDLQTWRTLSDEIKQADEHLGRLQAVLPERRKQTSDAAEQLQKADADLRIAERLFHDQQARQREILGEQTAEEFEATLQRQLETATRQLETQKLAQDKIHLDVETTRARVKSSQEEHLRSAAFETQRQQELDAWHTAFQQEQQRQLSLTEISTIAGRGPDWIQTERDELQQIRDNVTSAESGDKIQRKNLEQHQSGKDFTESQEQLVQTQRELVPLLESARETSEEVRAAIINDNLRRTGQTEKTDQLQKQRKAAEPILKLNELIGSAEGDKFRKLAQQQTLDILLRDTNYQLYQLTPRYRLERIPDSLNLMVVDQDMADEKRSVHSLSGGETFLVSLSLALGLAALASNRLKIESLFIDEGFGTLDDETLRTATHALMHLESQGRKVGVITHVAEMKDTIPVQIQVQRTGSGASQIIMPTR